MFIFSIRMQWLCWLILLSKLRSLVLGRTASSSKLYYCKVNRIFYKCFFFSFYFNWFLFVCLQVCLSVCLFGRWFVCLSVHLFVRSSFVRLSVCSYPVIMTEFIFSITGEYQNALHLMKTVHPTMHTMEDVRLHLSVLLANG